MSKLGRLDEITQISKELDLSSLDAENALNNFYNAVDGILKA